jgi:hypothetical protein
MLLINGVERKTIGSNIWPYSISIITKIKINNKSIIEDMDKKIRKVA